MTVAPENSTQRIHMIRHGEALHNVDREYAEVDPPLTERGLREAIALGQRLAWQNFAPSAIVTSPMTRTIQTALALFPELLQHKFAAGMPLHIWPELREAHDAICNKGRPRAELQAAYPDLDLSLCSEFWDYEAHSFESAIERAEVVRKRILSLPGFLAFLVQTVTRFENLELRTYRVAENLDGRFGTHENGDFCDFGPTLFVPDSSLDVTTPK
ncbi:phosphoglycerate mutase-like protein [Exidia glandulosa HHB12029]|uniref:Phosphoglycerate mutase-like protein n=1 Tax=Exidia glandulosa HHB12029 TaxID=1314781 RepID=A0A165FHV8_EXIGL|nr:phosphoglycerate mutase-like protein [Exidia glandulosa HHB12029]